MTGFEAFAAHAGHFLLYTAMLMLPVTGYLDSAFGGYHISVFGLFDIPMLFEKNKPLFELTVQAHRWIAYGLGLLVLAHAGAALKHHFIQRDDVLLRMLKDRPD
jgi:cytochrome b561